jgi:hypothetical protein
MLSGSAHALQEEDVACDPAIVSFSSPSNQQTNVPVNVVPAVGLIWGCDIAANYTLTLSNNAGEVTSVSLEANQNGSNLFELPLTAPLSADTEHTLEILGDQGWGEATVIRFTTGSNEAVEVTEAPELDIKQAIIFTQNNEYGRTETEYNLSPGADTDALSIVRVYNTQNMEEPILHMRTDVDITNDTFGNAFTHLGGMNAPFNSEICLIATQRDGLGNVAEMPAPVCATYEIRKESTCSVTSMAGLGWFMPLLAMAAIRRRPTQVQSERPCI